MFWSTYFLMTWFIWKSVRIVAHSLRMISTESRSARYICPSSLSRWFRLRSNHSWTLPTLHESRHNCVSPAWSCPWPMASLAGLQQNSRVCFPHRHRSNASSRSLSLCVACGPLEWSYSLVWPVTSRSTKTRTCSHNWRIFPNYFKTKSSIASRTKWKISSVFVCSFPKRVIACIQPVWSITIGFRSRRVCFVRANNWKNVWRRNGWPCSSRNPIPAAMPQLEPSRKATAINRIKSNLSKGSERTPPTNSWSSQICCRLLCCESRLRVTGQRKLESTWLMSMFSSISDCPLWCLKFSFLAPCHKSMFLLLCPILSSVPSIITFEFFYVNFVFLRGYHNTQATGAEAFLEREEHRFRSTSRERKNSGCTDLGSSVVCTARRERTDGSRDRHGYSDDSNFTGRSKEPIVVAEKLTHSEVTNERTIKETSIQFNNGE